VHVLHVIALKIPHRNAALHFTFRHPDRVSIRVMATERDKILLRSSAAAKQATEALDGYVQ